MFGYKGKQVRDNIHCYDLVGALFNFIVRRGWERFTTSAGAPPRTAPCSRRLLHVRNAQAGASIGTYSDQARSGDHMWWISDTRRFQADYQDGSLDILWTIFLTNSIARPANDELCLGEISWCVGGSAYHSHIGAICVDESAHFVVGVA